MWTETSTLRLAGALGVPFTMAAATVALAAYLGLSGPHEAPPPPSCGQALVLEDAPAAAPPAPASTGHG